MVKHPMASNGKVPMSFEMISISSLSRLRFLVILRKIPWLQEDHVSFFTGEVQVIDNIKIRICTINL